MPNAPNVPAPPIKRNRFIYETVREAIKGGSLPARLVLTESALARFFGVSRAPAADALSELAREGLVARHDGRGFVIGDGSGEPLRANLSEAGLRLPEGTRDRLAARSARDTLYPRVEVEVASASAYDNYHIGSNALAQHYGVSRTTSHEILSRLERVGLVEQTENGRWIVRQLTVQAVSDHYQMRRLLEPVALMEAVEAGAHVAVAKALARIKRQRRSDPLRTTREINAIEADLHRDIVLACPNASMRDTLHRSQLPLIATHAAFDRYRSKGEMRRVLDDHEAILTALASGAWSEASEAMVLHLRHGERTTLDYVHANPAPPPGLIPDYMTPVG